MAGEAKEDGTGRLDTLPAERAAAELLACCASERWAQTIVAARPFRTRQALVGRALDEIGALPWSDVLEALGAHPRIGDRVQGEAREAAWSRQEQAGMDESHADVRLALFDGNVAYEQRFGHVFLICATGKSADDMLAALTARLANTQAAEQDVVRGELAQITELRLRRLLDAVVVPAGER